MESEKMLSPRRAFGRAWEDFEPVTEPERRLAEAARAGDLCKFGEIAPETSETANTIRAEFLRFLALGGDDRAPLHERGVRLQGAFIAGELDLEGAELPFYIRLGHCRFSAQIILRGARGRTINLQASRLSGLIGERLKLDGGLLLTNVQVDGPIRLVGARIASDLECKGARFENPDDDALNCSRAKIGGGLFFGETTSIIGRISFAHAQVGTLGDASDCWPEGSLNLDGFIYEHISSRAPLDSRSRVAWLDRQQKRFLASESFALQPWSQLSKVLREQGHFSAAAEVDIAREDRLRNAGCVAPLPSPRRWWAIVTAPAALRKQCDPAFSSGAQLKLAANVIPWCLHWFYGRFAGYGYKPFNVIGIAFTAWLGCAGLYSYAAARAAFGPSNALVFQNKDYEHCRPDAQEKPENGKAKIGNWTRCPELPGEYSSFNSLAYSADLILPVVSLGQSHDWAPITTGDDWSLGYVTRLAVWGEELFGWVAALTLAAIASGLVKRKDGG
jgi:hypothetical protein